jgi:DNA-binding MarR family transcriptional regulator
MHDVEQKIPLKRRRSLDAIATGLPERASMLTRLFFAASKTGISRTEGTVLHALAEGPHRITELAFRVGITQPAVTQLVNRLEQRGWVVRTVDPADRRAVLVDLSAKGRKATDRMHQEYGTVMRAHMQILTDKELATLTQALDLLDHLIECFKGDLARE